MRSFIQVRRFLGVCACLALGATFLPAGGALGEDKPGRTTPGKARTVSYLKLPKLPVYVTTIEPGYFNPLTGVRDRAKQAGITLHETRVGDYLIVVPSKKMLAPPPPDAGDPVVLSFHTVSGI